MAAIFALSLVPAGAFAQGDPDPETTIANHNEEGSAGVLGNATSGKGTISIANAKKGETYEVYRLFELASFDDENVGTGQHGTNDEAEAYSYVIDLAEDNGAYTNKWATFLTTYGTDGAGSAAPYAIMSDDQNAATNTTAYFVIDSEPVTIAGPDGSDVSTYHYVRVNPNYPGNFSNANDDMGAYTGRTGTGAGQDADGNPVGIDYVAGSNSAIQNFAQEALKYAKANDVPLATKADGTASTAVTASGDGSTTLMTDAPLGYYLVGTSMGTLAALDTTNKDVTVYEKNDEPTVEKAILKKGEDFNDQLAADLVANSMADQQRRIDALNAEKTDLQAKLDGGTIQAGSQAYSDAEARIADIPGLIAAIEQEEPAWVKNTDCDLEDYVAFRTVITAQQGARDYRLHDVMEDGLQLVTGEETGVATDRYGEDNTPGAPRVYLVREGASGFVHEIEGTNTGVKNYELKTTGLTDGCDFEIWFKDATADDEGVDTDNKVTFFLGNGNYDDVKDGDKIVVVYWAKVRDGDVYGEQAAFWCEEMDQGTLSAVKDNSQSVISQQYNKDVNGNGRNDNYTVLTYGAKSHTQWDKASATVYEFDIAKTDAYDVDEGAAVKNKLLQGAKFKVYKATTGDDSAITNPIAVEKTVDNATVTFTQESEALLFDATAKPTYTYVGDVATADNGDGTVLESDKDGAIRLKGLEAGDYILVEEEAPAGYNKLAHPIVVTITGDIDSDGVGSILNDDNTNPVEDNEGYLTYRFTANDGSETTSETIPPEAGVVNSVYTVTNGGGVHIVNQTGQELPSTGGIGTTIFYVAGTVLVVGAAVMLVAKRRMGAEA